MASLDHIKQRIIDQVPLADLVGETVQLRSRSGLKVGLCPFHEEKGPSFTVYPTNYFCFGCRASGDAITFVRKTRGLGFIDALKYLADRFNIPADDLNQATAYKQERAVETQLFKIMQAAQSYFRERLRSPLGSTTRDYLIGRGFPEDCWQKYGFGLAPNDPKALLDALLKSGHRAKDIEACSLVATSAKNGKLYDFFRNRLMVPIHDVHGRLIAFGGRALDDYPPKYKNSRESLLFDKSQTLYGLHAAKDAMRRGQVAIVAEGYMDVLQLWQHGFEGAVACMGTALKTSHLRQMSQLTNKVVLIFDGDQAGQKASLSTVNAALKVPKIDIRVAALPNGEDPDSFLKSQGREALEELVKSAEPLFSYAIKSRLAEVAPTAIPDLLRKDFLPWLASMTDTLQRGYLLNQLAQSTGIPAATLSLEMRQLGGTSKAIVGATAAETPRARPKVRALSPLEYELIGHLFYLEPAGFDASAMATFIHEDVELTEPWLSFVELIFEELQAGRHPRETLASRLDDPLQIRLADKLTKNGAAFQRREKTSPSPLEKVQSEIRRSKIQESISTLKKRLRQAAPDEVGEIVTAISALHQDLKNA